MSQPQFLPRIGRIYQHYKGGTYKFLLTGRDEETQADLAIYSAVEGGQVWVRPLAEFQPPRFVEVVPVAPVLADQPWERFFKVADNRPNGRGETVIGKLADGNKLPVSYDGEAHTWKSATWEHPLYNFGQLLDNVIEWRYQASK